MNRKIILRQDVKGLGRRGEVVQVKPGYARNYLMPQGLAYPASEGNVRRVEAERRRHETRSLSDRAAAEELAARLAQVQLNVVKKVGENQELYGSVTAAELAQQLAAHGFSVDRKQLVIAEPIKKLGLFDVGVALHPEVTASVKVWVVKEEAAS
jgi:large subunit ribosomal protein L9